MRRARAENAERDLVEGGQRRAAERAEAAVTSGGGAALSQDDATRLGAAFGHDLSGVRVHTGPTADSIAVGLGARAFTIGSDIFLGTGEAPRGDVFMHEVAHTVQYGRGELPTASDDRVTSRPGDASERRADSLADSATTALRDGTTPSAFTAVTPFGGGGAAMIMRWDLPPGDGPLTDDELAHLRTMQTEEFHLRDGEVADMTPFRNRRADLIAAIRTIRSLLGSRLATTWNAHQDDIGTSGNPTHHTGHESYGSIFEYAIHLNAISGGDYLGFLRRQMNIRLAGWQPNLRVNPRTVYLAAAAQVLMDENGRDDPTGPHQAGQGHFVATAAVIPSLNEMQRMLTRLATQNHRPRTTPVDGGSAIFNSIRTEMLYLLSLLDAQRSNTPIRGHAPDEHLETAAAELLVPRIPAIQAVAVSATDADVPGRATQLLTALGHFPGAGAHEAGATDPHGTAHAMGVAYDMFDGTSPGANMWVGRADQMWPFIHYLIRHYPGSGLSTSMHTVHGASPETLHQLAVLLRDHATEATRELRDGEGAMWSAERADHNSSRERHDVLAARGQLRAALQDRLAALRGSSTLPLTLADRARIEAEMRAIEADLPLIRDLRVDELAATTQRHIDALREIVASHPAPDDGAPVERVGPLAVLSPDAGRDRLSTARETLARLLGTAPTAPGAAATPPGAAQAAVDRGDFQAALATVRSPGFESFLADVGRHQIYDQSRVMVNAMQDVTGANTVQGMHHWQVVPMVGPRGQQAPATDNDATYQQTLARDMGRRSDAQLERILCVMAESAGGRQLLFGAPTATPPQPADAVLRAALDSRLPGRAQAMLDAVRARVVTPLEHSGRTTDGDSLRDQLRSMGIYLSARSTPATSGGPLSPASSATTTHDGVSESTSSQRVMTPR
jgi:hypothetical protein